jgi:poly-gamma-glutamate synthesis protein (capsule biosynthesis protein)
MKLILLGDMAFFGKCSLNSNSQAHEYFSEVADRLSLADYVVGNLETPFSVKKKTHDAKSAYICSDVENVGLLKLLHVNAVTLANNHMFDYGKEGYETTKKILKENNIDFFGSEGKGLSIDINGNHLKFEGFCCYSSGPLEATRYGNYGVHEYDVEEVERILSSRDIEGGVCILSVHAGREHINYPSLDHVGIARRLASRHKIIYYGHHPHVVQGIERKGDSLIAYSLGNFCFDDVWSSASSKHPLIELSENNRTSLMMEIVIEENEIKEYHIIPIYIGEDKIHVGTGATQESIEKYTEIINSLSPIDYENMRNKLLAERMEKRKAQRNLLFYLKRIRWRYVKAIINAKRNRKQYVRCLNLN